MLQTLLVYRAGHPGKTMYKCVYRSIFVRSARSRYLCSSVCHRYKLSKRTQFFISTHSFRSVSGLFVNLCCYSIHFWLCQELRVSQCPSVCPAQTCLNLHLSLSDLSSVCKLSYFLRSTDEA